MPAATIVGSQVNEITRPGDIKDFKATLLNNFMDSTGSFLFPNNYGLEFNPYHLLGMPNFEYSEYLDDKMSQNIWRTLSLSFATNNQFVVNDTVNTNALGLGARVTLLKGTVSQDLRDAVLKARKGNLDGLNILSDANSFIRTYLNEDSLTANYSKNHLMAWLLSAINQYYSPSESKQIVLSAVKQIFDLIPESTKMGDVANAFSDAYIEHIQSDRLTTLQTLLDRVKTERYGWKLDVNYAQALNFPNNNWNESVTSRLGAWLNLSFTPSKKESSYKVPTDFQFILLGRVTSVNQDFVDSFQPDTSDFKIGTNFDLGLRLVYDTKKFSVEGEFIQRWNRKKITREIDGMDFFAWQGDNSNKFVLNLNYNVSKDVVISYNIGKNYDSAFKSTGNLISGLTVNFGFGGYKLEDLLK